MADTQFISVRNIGSGFPKRRLILELYNSTSKKSTWVNGSKTSDKQFNIEEQLHIKVSFDRSMGGLGLAKIEIANLLKSTVDEFTYLNYAAKKTPDLVRVYGGYESVGQAETDFPLIFEGYILYAVPTTARTDVMFQIEAMEQFVNYEKVITPKSYSFIQSRDGVKNIQQIVSEMLTAQGFIVDLTAMKNAKEIFDKNGRGDYWKRTYEYEPLNFSAPQMRVRDFLTSGMRQLNKMQFIQDGGTIFIYPSSDDGAYMSSLMNLGDVDTLISALGRDYKGDARADKKLQMIGIPQVNFYGVKCRILYVPADEVKAGNYFKLASAFFNKWNRYIYQIISCKYTLSTRSQEFYIDIEAIRANNPNSNANATAMTDSNASDYIEPTPEEKAKGISEKIIKFQQNSVPAKVVAILPNNRVRVQPLLKFRTSLKDDKTGAPIYTEYPEFDVQVQRLGAGNTVVIVPLEVGSTGELIAADRNTDNYYNPNSDLGKVVDPQSMEYYQWKFGVFVPDVVRGFTVNTEDEGSLSIQSMGGETRIVLDPSGEVRVITPNKIKMETSAVEITAPTSTFNGNVIINGTITTTTSGGGTGEASFAGEVKAGTIGLMGHIHRAQGSNADTTTSRMP